MKKGLGDIVSINARTEQIIRLSGLLLPIVLCLYGLFVFSGAVQTGFAGKPLVLSVVGTTWLALGLYQFFVPSTSGAESALRLIAYHIFAAVYVLLVSGVDMPFIATWTLLFLASYAYAGRRGLGLSVAFLFIIGVINTILYIGNSSYVTLSSLYLTSVLILGYVAGTITSAAEVDRRELSRSQAEETLQRDRILTLVNNLADGILSTDRDGIIQVYNAASLNLLDTNNELKGKPIDSIIRLVDKDNRLFKFKRAFRTSRSVETREDLSAVISGETVHLSIIYSPIRSTDSHAHNNHDGYIVILRDITKQKSLEEERDEFISVVSHELRTPITIAEGSLSNVQVMMDRTDIPKTTLIDSIKVSHDQVLFLAKMVNDLSTLSRAERGVGDAVEEIDISEMIHDLYNEYASQAEAKGLQFNLDLSPQLGSLTTSRLYLKELLQNFVTNAIKYTKAGEVTVEVKRTKQTIRFAIHDSGIGISKSDQQHIYDRFWRSEDYRTRETGGTGLGLYVSTKLAKKLGTEIELKSRLNHGSVFAFTLPIPRDR